MDKFEVGAEVAQMMSKMLSVGGTSPKIMISTETGIIQVTSPSGSRMTYSDVPFCCVPDLHRNEPGVHPQVVAAHVTVDPYEYQVFRCPGYRGCGGN
ncbi:hypothetical protein LCGC14_2371450, partial [marine sediment metagenome]